MSHSLNRFALLALSVLFLVPAASHAASTEHANSVQAQIAELYQRIAELQAQGTAAHAEVSHSESSSTPTYVKPSGTFDRDSLTAPADKAFTISGTAQGVVSIRVGIGQNGQNYFNSAAVRVPPRNWSVRESMGLSAGTYNMAVYGFTDASGTIPVNGVGEGGILTGAYLKVLSADTHTATGTDSSMGSTTTKVIVTNGTTSATLHYNANDPSKSYGVYTLSFDVQASGGDAYIPRLASTTKSDSVGVLYDVVGSTTFKGDIGAALTSTADQSGGYFLVHAGQTETFTTNVTLNPKTSGTYAVRVGKLRFNSHAAPPVKSRVMTLTTDPLYIPDSAKTAIVANSSDLASAMVAVQSGMAALTSAIHAYLGH